MFMKKYIFFIGIITFLSSYTQQNFDDLPDHLKPLLAYRASKNIIDPTYLPPLHENHVRSDNGESLTITWTEPIIINDKNPIDVITFTNNVNYKPGKNYNYPSYYQNYPAAIIIDRNNVTIDLAGFNLSLDPSSATSFLVNNPTFGIAITAGTKNIKIISSSSLNSKGSISEFTGYAIYGLGSNQVFNSYDIYQNYIQNIEINNLLLTANASGIYLSDALQANITETNIVYNFSSRATYGIYYSNVLQSSIRNCNVNQNYSWINMIGMYLQDTINCSVINCQASYNRSLKNGDAIGIQLTATSLLGSFVNTIFKCTANTNLSSYTTGKESIGFLINGHSHTNIISECQTFYNTHGPSFGSVPPLIGPKGYGIKIEQSNNNQVSKNLSGYHSHFGYLDISLISSSFFTNNVGIFNTVANYAVDIANGVGSEPLPVLEIYQNDLEVYNYQTPNFMNLSIKSGSA